MTPQEMAAETTSVYDNYVEVLETGSVEALQHYARDLSERIIPRGVETHEVVGIVLLLRDVLARSLFEKYQRDFALLNRVLDAYEPAANRIANTVAVSFVDERERVIRQQQDSIRELSTPVLPVRERLLILPIIGVLDSERARQLTEQLLSGIRTHRAKVVVIDITGAPDVDEAVANHLVQTVDASRLMGASVIITGLSPEIAQTLVTIGVDLSKMNTIGDLQGGLEEAERLLGYQRDPDGRCGELVNAGPALVSILRQGRYLIASIHTALDDSEMVRFQQRPDRPDRRVPGARRHHRRRRPGRARLLRLAHAARHRRDGPTARRGDGDRRASSPMWPSRWCALGMDTGSVRDRAGPRGGPGLPRRPQRVGAAPGAGP